MSRFLKILALACLLATKSGLAVTVTLTETIPFFQLPYVAAPGVVILCLGTSFSAGAFTFCDDGNGDAENPVGSVQFFAPDLVNMRTNGMICADGFPGRFPSLCAPFFNGDAAVDFEDPPLPDLPSETPYTPGMNDPGFGFFQGMAVDYVLVTNVPLPEPVTIALVAIGLGLLLGGRLRIKREGRLARRLNRTRAKTARGG